MCVTQSDSALPTLRYCTFCISRSSSESSVFVVSRLRHVDARVVYVVWLTVVGALSVPVLAVVRHRERAHEPAEDR